MPVRGKRRPNDWDPNKSDPEDETYGTSVSKPSRSRHSKSKRSKPARKKQKREYSDDDDEEEESSADEESDLSVEDSPEEVDEVEIGATGRPKRKAAPRDPIVDKSESEQPSEDEQEEEVEVEEAVIESDSDDNVETPKRQRSTQQRQIIVLSGTPGKFPPKLSPPEATRRSTRARSSSVTGSRPTSSHKPPSRRSSRIAHDEGEDMYALTNSGHHVETVRPSTTSPPPAGKRPKTGGKGIKKPTTSVVYEASQESGSRREQAEVAASREDLDDEPTDIVAQIAAAAGDDEDEVEAKAAEAEPDADVAIIPESGEDNNDDDDDEDPISKPSRSLRRRDSKKAASSGKERGETSNKKELRSSRAKRKAKSSQRTAQESSDFDPEEEENADEDLSESEASASSPRKRAHEEGDDSSPARGAKRRKPNPRSRRVSDERESELDPDELQEELHDLASDNGRRRRQRQQADILYEPRPKTRRQAQRPDYRIINPDVQFPMEEEDVPLIQSTPSKRARGTGGATYQRSLFSTYGPFGGAGGPPPVLGGPGGLGATAGADSDSSDDEVMQRPKASGMPGVGGMVGMTPTTAGPPNLGLFPAPAAQVHGADPNQTPANLGRVKDKQTLADADPLGVDQNVNFDAVGGLEGHIDQLKEMVALPLLYPEVFQRFHVTPPRGVLFHGPPGTGKTLLARALASSVSSQGRKVTFYMRKGADALSKWVGEAEKQLRLLFEEARKNQPSIIFFDEIDGWYSKVRA